jgi:hypothetical protein
MKGLLSHVRSVSSFALVQDRKRKDMDPILEKLDFNINCPLSL